MSRYKKLFDYLETELNAIALDSNLMEIEDIVKAMIAEDQPAPLDPHTCELCVGDVVENLDGIDCIVLRGSGEEYKAYNSFSRREYTYHRSQLTLKSNQRAGVQITPK